MLEKYKINADYSIKEAIEVLDKNVGNVVFIVDEVDILQGIFTQGDMRKYILKSTDLNVKIVEAMNRNPITFPSIRMAEKAKDKKKMAVYPIVTAEMKLVDAIFEREKQRQEVKVSDALSNVPLVIMAGGKGTRLYPYTKVLPKALIPIGDYTISERIINNFTRFGCEEVYFILNYKANMIKAYFSDIEKNYQVNYIVENEFLGTAGGLGLLKGKVNNTFVLSNCDILVNDDLECIYRTHKKNENKITFVCAMKNIVIPYGVVKANEKGEILSLEEKPELSFLTNTGVYILEPEVISELNAGEFVHLPDVAKRYIEKGEKVGVFPISEQAWLDMGQFSEMKHMMEVMEDGGEV